MSKRNETFKVQLNPNSPFFAESALVDLLSRPSTVTLRSVPKEYKGRWKKYFGTTVNVVSKAQFAQWYNTLLAEDDDDSTRDQASQAETGT